MIYRQGLLAQVAYNAGDTSMINVYTVPLEAAYADVQLSLRLGPAQSLVYAAGTPVLINRNDPVLLSTAATTIYSYSTQTFRVPSGTTVGLLPLTSSNNGSGFITIAGVEYQKIDGSKYRFTRAGKGTSTTTATLVFETIYTCPSDVEYAIVNPRTREIATTDYCRFQILRSDGSIVGLGNCGGYNLSNADGPLLEQSAFMYPGDQLQICLRNTTPGSNPTYYNLLTADIHETLK
ncbi:hypothetical protein [Delftia phage PhiW-14]|uniref:Uncharacterized protein n=1 Tax=Delftia phage PhiW-14 TaxID=665032 RepID=C9DG25_BPW14|nr:hypothetical protein DP-phiW-14_gp054 [Delftia phage PhiW-14]ACV50076.1 hypothetical protein [Delftia phage PhiW-14]